MQAQPGSDAVIKCVGCQGISGYRSAWVARNMVSVGSSMWGNASPSLFREIMECHYSSHVPEEYWNTKNWSEFRLRFCNCLDWVNHSCPCITDFTVGPSCARRSTLSNPFSAIMFLLFQPSPVQMTESTWEEYIEINLVEQFGTVRLEVMHAIRKITKITNTMRKSLRTQCE